MTSNVDNSSLTQTLLNKYWHSSSKSRTLFLICMLCSLTVIILSSYLMKSAMIQIAFSEADDEDNQQKEDNNDEQKQSSSSSSIPPPVKSPVSSSPSISSSFRSLFGLGKTAADEQRERQLKNKLIEESRFNFPLTNVASPSLDSPAPTSIKSASSSVSTTSNSRFSHKEKLETIGGRTIHSKHYLKMNKQYMADLDAREKQKRDRIQQIREKK